MQLLTMYNKYGIINLSKGERKPPKIKRSVSNGRTNVKG